MSKQKSAKEKFENHATTMIYFVLGVVIEGFMSGFPQFSLVSVSVGSILLILIFFFLMIKPYLEKTKFKLDKRKPVPTYKKYLFGGYILISICFASTLTNFQIILTYFNLVGLEKGGQTLLAECGNEDGHGVSITYNSDFLKWKDEMNGFIWSDAIRNDREFEHWRGLNNMGDDYFGGVGFWQQRPWDIIRPINNPPASSFNSGEYREIEMDLTRIEYYRDELLRKIFNMSPRSPVNWANPIHGD